MPSYRGNPMDSLIAMLERRLDSPSGNTWIQHELMNVLVRKCRRIPQNRVQSTQTGGWNNPCRIAFPGSYRNPVERAAVLDCLDIVAVTVHQRGRGTFTRFLNTLESRRVRPLIYVGSVVNKRFGEFFQRRGYVMESYYGAPPSFWKILGDSPPRADS